MKRVIAWMLIICFSFSYIEAFADTLTLPSGLKMIDSQAFYGDTSLDVVELPYGMETIKSKAFAYSSVNEIYIPSTVTYIADNAFDGLPDLMIRAPQDSYAYEYAELNDIICEGYKDHSSSEVIEEIIDSLDEDEDILQFDEFDYTLYSRDGIEDIEVIESIEKYNQNVIALQGLDEEYNTTMDELMETLSTLSPLIENTVISSTDDGMTLECDDFTYTIAGGDLLDISNDFRIVSKSTSQSGYGVQIELENNGSTYFLSGDEYGFSLSSALTGRSVVSLRSRGGTLTSSNDNNSIPDVAKGISIFVDWAKSHWSSIVSGVNNLIKILEKGVEAAANKEFEQSVMVAFYEAKLDHTAEELANAILNNSPDINELATKNEEAAEQLKNAEKQLEKLSNEYAERLKWLERCKSTYKTIILLNPIAIAWTIGEDIQKFGKVNSIEKHGHPTVTDSEQYYDAIHKMNQAIPATKQFLVLDIINNGFDLIMSLNEIAALFEKAAGPGGWLAGWLQKMGIKKLKKYITEYTERKLSRVMRAADTTINAVIYIDYRTICETDKMLHGTLTGRVVDDFNRPVKGVKVSCSTEYTYTDSSGNYSLSVGKGQQTIVFSKKGYAELSREVTITEDTPPLNVELISWVAISGTVYDAVSLQPLSGVTVTWGKKTATTDSNGFYSIVVKAGTINVSYTKDGYITTQHENMYVDPYQSSPHNAYMSQLIEEKQYRVVLTWGETPRDLDSHLSYANSHIYYANKKDGNATLDVDDTTSYGPETLTFKVDSDETYRYSVYDYTNLGNSSSNALSHSGAIVRVYSSDRQIGTYYVPSGIGTIWSVFKIENGKFKLLNYLL